MAVLSDGRKSYWGNRWTMNGDDKSIISVTWWWQIDHIGHVVIMTNRSYQSRGDDDKSIISVTWWWQIDHISHVYQQQIIIYIYLHSNEIRLTSKTMLNIGTRFGLRRLTTISTILSYIVTVRFFGGGNIGT